LVPPQPASPPHRGGWLLFGGRRYRAKIIKRGPHTSPTSNLLKKSEREIDGTDCSERESRQRCAREEERAPNPTHHHKTTPSHVVLLLIGVGGLGASTVVVALYQINTYIMPAVQPGPYSKSQSTTTCVGWWRRVCAWLALHHISYTSSLLSLSSSSPIRDLFFSFCWLACWLGAQEGGQATIPIS